MKVQNCGAILQEKSGTIWSENVIVKAAVRGFYTRL